MSKIKPTIPFTIPFKGTRESIPHFPIAFKREMRFLEVLWRVDDGLNRRCVKVKTVNGFFTHGVENLSVHSIEVSLYLVHVDDRC